MDKLYFGIIENINLEKGFGFIKSDEFADNIYFRISNESLKEIGKNDEVVFRTKTKDDGRLKAIHVRRLFRDFNGTKFVKNWREGWVHFDPAEWLPFISEKIELAEKGLTIQQFDFDQIVGKTSLVKENQEVNVFYAVRDGRFGFSRLSSKSEGTDSNSIVLTFRPYGADVIEILSGFIGKRTPPEPYSEFATPESLEFWKCHALVANDMAFDESTKIIECPW